MDVLPLRLTGYRYWIETGYDVHLISTFPCDPPAGLASFHILPVAFGRMAGDRWAIPLEPHANPAWSGSLRSRLRLLRYYLGPFSLAFYQGRYRALVAEIQPDLVHALRIPFEGMLATTTPAEIPLVVSTWGNDLTLHARGSFFMSRLTRSTLNRADGLITDTQRDIRLGHERGFETGKPTLIVPGSGGIRLKEIESSSKSRKLTRGITGCADYRKSARSASRQLAAGYLLSGHPNGIRSNSTGGFRLPFSPGGY